MRILNDELLQSMRAPGRCDYCGKKCKAREGHHIHTRGAGQLDIRVNLIALGASRPFPICPCHSYVHDGTLLREDCYQIVSVRETVDAHDIEPIIFAFRRLPKNPRRDEIEREIEGLSARAKEIVLGELQRLELWKL